MASLANATQRQGRSCRAGNAHAPKIELAAAAACIGPGIRKEKKI